MLPHRQGVQLIQERTKGGLDAARARGRLGKAMPVDDPRVQTAKNMHAARSSVAGLEIAW